MPDPFERHSRPNGCCENWYGQPSRSQLRAAATADSDRPAKRGKGRKDPSLCKAAHWKGPHTPELRIREYSWRRNVACKWAVSWRSENGEPSWHCGHEEVCAGCGKVLRTRIGSAECPAFHPITVGERAAIDAEHAADEARLAAAMASGRGRWRRQPVVIDGPQGYRRKRSA